MQSNRKRAIKFYFYAEHSQSQYVRTTTIQQQQCQGTRRQNDRLSAQVKATN